MPAQAPIRTCLSPNNKVYVNHDSPVTMSGIWGYPTSREPRPSPSVPPSQSWDVFTFSAPPTRNDREDQKDGDQGQYRHLSFTFPPSPQIFFFSQQCRRHQPKRRRRLSDVDGEGTDSMQRKKKRRLRLSFVTSRLSRPFSSPPTHIITRGTSKIAIWAKQKALRRSSLRRAAIMNRLRKNALSTRDSEPHRFEMARWTFMYDYLITPSSTAATAVTTSPAITANIPANSTYPSPALSTPAPPAVAPPPRPPPHPPTADQLAQIDKLISQSGSQPSCLRPTRRTISPSPSPPSPQSSPRKQYIPLPSSPLSLTNYDIFDNEDGYFDSSDGESSDDDFGGGSNTTSPQNGIINNNDNSTDNSKSNKKKRKSSRIYSDFNILEPTESVIEDDHDSLSAFDSLPFWGRWLPEVGSSEEDEKEAEMRLEKERQKEVSFVRFEV